MFKVYLSYVVALMVVLQSFIAVADIHQTDLLQESEQISLHLSAMQNHEDNHRTNNLALPESDVFDENDAYEHMFITLLSDFGEGEDKHAECHHGHCHHGSVVFIVKHHQFNLSSMNESKVNIDKINLSSLLLTPDLRPPIFNSY
jgi:hypothetical protein